MTENKEKELTKAREIIKDLVTNTNDDFDSFNEFRGAASDSFLDKLEIKAKLLNELLAHVDGVLETINNLDIDFKEGK